MYHTNWKLHTFV